VTDLSCSTCLSPRSGEEERDNQRVDLYFFTAQHVIRIPHYRPSQGSSHPRLQLAFHPSADGWMSYLSPTLSRPLDARSLQPKATGIFIGSEFFTQREVLDLLHDHFPIKRYKYDLVIDPEDRDQSWKSGLKLLWSELRQARLKLSAALYNPRVDTLNKALTTYPIGVG